MPHTWLGRLRLSPRGCQGQLLSALLQALEEKPRSVLPTGPLTRNLLPEGLPWQVDNFRSLPQRSSKQPVEAGREPCAG